MDRYALNDQFNTANFYFSVISERGKEDPMIDELLLRIKGILTKISDFIFRDVSNKVITEAYYKKRCFHFYCESDNVTQKPNWIVAYDIDYVTHKTSYEFLEFYLEPFCYLYDIECMIDDKLIDEKNMSKIKNLLFEIHQFVVQKHYSMG